MVYMRWCSEGKRGDGRFYGATVWSRFQGFRLVVPSPKEGGGGLIGVTSSSGEIHTVESMNRRWVVAGIRFTLLAPRIPFSKIRGGGAARVRAPL